MTPLQTLRQLGTGEEPPLAAKRRVLRRVQESVALGAVLDAKVAAAGPPPVGAAVVSGGFFASGGAKVAFAVAFWLSGAATGLWLYRSSAAPPVAPVASVVPVVPVTSPIPAVSAVSSVAIAPSAAPRAESPKPSPRSERRPTPPASTLERERRLLDRARAALGTNGEAALEAISQHERDFPQGALREERLAMQVRALESLGRHAEARTRALDFRDEFPNSFLMPALEAVLAEP